MNISKNIKELKDFANEKFEKELFDIFKNCDNNLNTEIYKYVNLSFIDGINLKTKSKHLYEQDYLFL
jgi:hypothetical protein